MSESHVLEVKHLRLVQEVMSAGSLSAAAERLHVTQSALSHQLRELESRLGVRVFDREGRRLTLTEAGRRLAEAGARVLPDLRAVEASLQNIEAQPAAPIRIAAECHTVYSWLGTLAKRFRQSHPSASIAVVPEAGQRPLRALLDGDVDVVLHTAPQSKDKRVRQVTLFKDEMVVIVARDHRFARASAIQPADLAGEHLLIYSSRPETSFTVQRILKPSNVRPASLSHVQLTEAMIALARAGAGVAILPRWSAQDALARNDVRAIRITRRGMGRQWSAACLAASQPDSDVRQFFDLLTAQLRGRPDAVPALLSA